MSIEKFVSPFIPQQFPAFYKEEGPNFISFVKAYYEWMESSNQTLNHARSLLEYSDIDTTEQQFLKYFKNTYLNSLPESIIADKRLLVKHILDLYRAKGTPRAYELLFRLVFNEPIEIYIPGNFLFKPSDGTWTVPRYIEVSDNDYLEDLIGKQIYNSSGNARAVVESVNKKIINNKLIHVLYLTSIEGRFKYGEKILSTSVPKITLDNAPTIIGSLTAVAIENGGANFTIGDTIDVYGAGVGGKARVAQTRSENGKVTFNLLNGGSGYTVDAVITVATALDLLIQNTVSTFNVGDTITSTDTSANGKLTFANNTFLQLIEFSANLNFNVGDTITNGTGATATINTVIGGGGAGATFNIGGLTNKEILSINTDYIESYLYDVLNATWDFSPKNSVANINSTIIDTLTFRTVEAGSIAFLSNINPGTGYSAPPYISIIEPDVAAEGISDGFGGIKGRNAIVNSRVGSSRGVVTAVELINSGFGFNPGETVLMTTPTNEGIVVTGTSVIDTDGKGDGYWESNKGFLSDIIKIQDSYYYQTYSYDVLVNRMLGVYEKVVKDLVHPSGIALFGRFRLKNDLISDESITEAFLLAQTTSQTFIDGAVKYLKPAFTFTRPSIGYGFVDGTLTSFASDVPRWVDYPSGGYGLLMESQRANYIINPRCEGSTPGIAVGGAGMPTDFASFAQSSLTLQIIGASTVNGIPGVIMRMYGTSTSTFAVLVPRYNSGAGIPTTGGNAWCSSMYFQKLSGEWTNIKASVGYREIGGSSAVPSTDFTPSGALERQYVSGATTTGVTGIYPSFGLRFPNATAIDVTFFVGGFQAEVGSTPTSIILPLVGSPAVTTRAISKSSTARAFSAIGFVGTYLFAATLPVATSSTFRNFFQIDDGTDTNRYFLRTNINSSTVTLYRVNNNVGTSGVAVGTIVAGVPFKLALTMLGNGEARASFNGGAVVSQTGGPTSGLSNLRFGNDAGGYLSTFDGIINSFTYSPTIMTDAQLQAATTL